MYIISFILIFYHFSNIPFSQENACRDAKTLGNNCNFSSPLGSIAIIFYIYITLIALYSLSKKGSIPKYDIKGISRRKFIISLLLFLFFSSLIIGIMYLISVFMIFGALVFGYSLYVIWLLLEPFLLLGGILGMMDIITRDYPLKGYGRRTKFFILFNIIIALIGSSLILRAEQSSIGDFVDFLDYQFYRPAFEALSNSFRTLVSITLLTIFIWFILDRFKEKSGRREDKKGVLPWLFLIAMILAAVSIIPIMLSTEGDLVEFTSITDLFTLFLAIILGVWRVLEVSKSEEVLKGWEKLNSSKLLSRIDPYTKALFLFDYSVVE